MNAEEKLDIKYQIVANLTARIKELEAEKLKMREAVRNLYQNLRDEGDVRSAATVEMLELTRSICDLEFSGDEGQWQLKEGGSND